MIEPIDVNELLKKIEHGSGFDHDINTMVYSLIFGWSYPLTGDAFNDFMENGGNYSGSFDAVDNLYSYLAEDLHYTGVGNMTWIDQQCWIELMHGYVEKQYYKGHADSKARAYLAALMRAWSDYKSRGIV